jgi:hypothetical protein
MSDRATDYVLTLGRDSVTVTQKAVLRAIADHHSERYGTADVDIQTLVEETLLSRRHLRRIFEAIGHLVEYRPGVGRGNFGQFTFLHLPERPTLTFKEKGTKRGQKGDIFECAIRKEDQNQTPDQNQSAFDRDGGDRAEISPISSSDQIEDDIKLANASLAQCGSLPLDMTCRAIEQPEVLQVLEAFNQSPVIAHKANSSDEAMAAKLLQVYTVAEIERGIVLGSGRRYMTDLNHGYATRVASLAYFVPAIQEAQADGLMTEAYIDRIRLKLKRIGQERKPVGSVAS